MVKKKAVAKKKIVKKMVVKKRTSRKRSENARAVAKDVKRAIGKHMKVNFGNIVKDNGYSDSTSKNPQLVTETKSYKEEMDPFVKRMIKERNEALKFMPSRRIKANYGDLTRGVDTLTKNIELVSGRPTERVEKELPPEQAEKLDKLLKKNQK